MTRKLAFSKQGFYATVNSSGIKRKVAEEQISHSRVKEETVTLAELSSKVRFVTDPEGNQPVVQLDLSTWEEIVAALEAAQYISLVEAARRAGVSQETMTAWLEKGILPGTKVAESWLVAAEGFEEFAPLERILDEMDAERPPLSPQEAAEVVSRGREGWTWIGKEK